MKDSHRDTTTFMKLQKVIRRQDQRDVQRSCSTFPMRSSAPPASGRSTPGWVRGRYSRCATRWRAATSKAAQGDHPRHRRRPERAKPNLSWRETASKLGIGMAGYVEPGPLRAPFLDIPQEVIDGQTQAGRALAAPVRQIRAGL